MIHDDSPTIHELRLRRIIKARSSFSEKLMRLSLPSLNLNASQNYEIVDWWNTPKTELSATKAIPDEELQLLIANKGKTLLHLFITLLHASREECDTTCDWSFLFSDIIDGFIRVKMVGSKRLHVFETKRKDFKLKKMCISLQNGLLLLLSFITERNM